MNMVYRTSADCIWLFHFFVVVLALFGWLMPNLWYAYMATLAGALLSELALGYCFLSKWEFDLRKKINSALDYDYSYASYYTYKFTHQHLSSRFLAQLGIIFTSLSIMINLYFKFLY